MRPGLGRPLLAAVVLLVAALPARGDEYEAWEVKAAYLRYIAEFTTWPRGAFATPQDPIVIGTMGDDRSGVVAAIRKRIEGKGLSPKRRPIVVRTLRYEEVVGDAPVRQRSSHVAGCHLLFVGASEQENWPTIREAIRGQPVVTVSEIAGFSRSCGMIELAFSQEESRVVMHIDLDTLRRAGLDLSSQLLGLRKVVKIVRDACDDDRLATNGEGPG